MMKCWTLSKKMNIIISFKLKYDSATSLKRKNRRNILATKRNVENRNGSWRKKWSYLERSKRSVGGKFSNGCAGCSFLARYTFRYKEAGSGSTDSESLSSSGRKNHIFITEDKKEPNCLLKNKVERFSNMLIEKCGKVGDFNCNYPNFLNGL